ncbi:PREDICTED: cilia- and flagella-associated protein 100-like isoform X2 [Branchiostoma belcheri]|uniref:Cilia- and flagella-associated protein 100-like isoform X2 n=1 Tax=Branchiostoma belcheri TaxID=7741 RepID=A0A6P4YT13_BRABE|nr:PREDICTED: cilia- and flagella-associated protein 100-like isoform X2 [Branchiostoma belcheri]
MSTASRQSSAASPVSANSKSRAGTASRQSGRVTFPQSPGSGAGSPMSEGTQLAPDHNPFTMPVENDIFILRDKERQKKKAERVKQRNLRVHEKTTYATRVNAKTASMRKAVIESSESEDEREDEDKAVAVKEDPSWTIAVTRDRHVEKEDLAEYINKKREMFLVQYSLGVKRDEMRKLEEIAAAEERKLELAEQYLEEDAAMFDEFLKENDKNSVEAIKIAESETKAKLEKVSEIKRINGQMMAIKSEISKMEDTLKEYQLYKKFLDSVTPQEYKDKKEAELEEKRKQLKKASAAKKRATVVLLEPHEEEAISSTPNLLSPPGASSNAATTPASDTSGRGASRQLQSRESTRRDRSGTPLKGSSTGRRPGGTPASGAGPQDQPESDEEEDSEEEPDLFFTDPQQLLDLFQELEEQNLSLIQNSQETEEALEEMRQTFIQTEGKMNRETEILKQQITMLKDTITREEEKAADLEMKSKMFSYGEFKAEDQEKMLQSLNKKVEEVYRACIGDNEANISTLQMLTNIENRLEELFEIIEMMPPERVEAAERAKEKERRLRLREEKLEQQRLHQEERVRRALERAQADPKKKGGRKLVFRSEPPRRKAKKDKAQEKATREEEELAYFFT